jgi:chemotaxis protein methyltransferase CheR
MSYIAALDDKDFQLVRTLIHQRVGINLGQNKKAMVFSRLSRRLRQLQLGSFPEYLTRMDDPAAAEWQFFTNALTTNLTSFFREEHHFYVLADQLGAYAHQQKFRIWCAAASTGEEPYSIAMVVNEVGGDGPRQVEILASDVNTQVLEWGANGVYPQERIEKLAPGRVKKFFMKGSGSGPQAGLCRVKPVLRESITFKQINLLDEKWSIEGAIDVIFCRNVMIYFDKDTQRKLIVHFLKYMNANSLFIAGHSESFHHCADLLTSMGRTVYRRADA